MVRCSQKTRITDRGQIAPSRSSAHCMAKTSKTCYGKWLTVLLSAARLCSSDCSVMYVVSPKMIDFNATVALRTSPCHSKEAIRIVE